MGAHARVRAPCLGSFVADVNVPDYTATRSREHAIGMSEFGVARRNPSACFKPCDRGVTWRPVPKSRDPAHARPVIEIACAEMGLEGAMLETAKEFFGGMHDPA